MSCRPTAPSRLLSRPSLSLLLPRPPPPGWHCRCQCPVLNHLSVRLQSKLASSLAFSPVPVPVPVPSEVQDDADGPKTAATAVGDSVEHVHGHVPAVSPPPRQDANRRTACSGLAERLAAATESARLVDRLRMHKYWLMRTMYSGKLKRHSRLRYLWSNFKRLLWSDQDKAVLSEQVPALSRYKQQATELDSRLQLGCSVSEDGPTTLLLARCHPLGLIIGAMAHSAKLTLTMLDFLAGLGPVPFQITADCLLYLRHSYLDELKADPVLMSSYERQLAALRNPQTWPRHLRSSHMDILLHGLTQSETRALLLQFLEKNKLSAMPNRSSYLFVMDAFLRLKDVDGALQTLAAFPPSDLESPDKQLLHRIIAILHLETVHDSGGVAFLSVLPRLLQMGVKPNETVQNKSIRNAVKFDLTPLAWDLVTYAQESEIKIEGSATAALLRHSFRKQDLARLNQIMSAIHQSTALSQEPYLIMDMMNIVRLVCYYDRKASPSQSLAHLLTIYDRAYNRSLLSKLGILGPSHALPAAAADDPLPDPPAMVCAFLIWTYVYVQRSYRPVLSLWERWAELIDQGDPLICAAAQYDIAFNGFLLFLARSRYSVANVPLILRFMLDKTSCKPSEITWSHCITAYLQWRDQDHPAAHEIKAILLEKQAKISDKEWKQYIQPRFPSIDLESPEARQFVHIEPSSSSPS